MEAPSGLSVCRVKGHTGLVEVEEREAGRAPTLDAASSVTLGVVAGMPFTLYLDPLGHFEFVVEPEHRSSPYKMVREPLG